MEKIVSGGQTGVDRGALDAALDLGFPCGGWCPEDRSAEDGPIAARYPLTPLVGGGYPERTRQNVTDSDGTVILFDGVISGGDLTGGTRFTRTVCAQTGRPLLVIDAAKIPAQAAADAIVTWVKASGIRVLNVAGPRASQWPAGWGYAREVIQRMLRE